MDDLIELNFSKIKILQKEADLIYSSEIDGAGNKTTLKRSVRKIVCGSTPSTKDSDNWKGNMPFITTPDMAKNTFVVTTERTINPNIDLVQSRKIDRGSISVSCIGTIGIVSMTAYSGITNQQINTVIPNKGETYFMFHVLKNNISQLKGMTAGSATPNISKDTFSSLTYLEPSKERIYKFEKEVKPIYEEMLSLYLMNQQLFQEKRLLLKKYF